MDNKYWWIIGLLILFSGGGVFVWGKTRGLRNKNPGNIRYNPANDWKGQIGKDDKDFVIFSDAKWGIRAIGKTIDSYQNRGIMTIAQIITTWAPNTENDTKSYIESVSKSVGYPSDFIPSRVEGDFPELVAAIIKHENGFNPYSIKEITDALKIV